MVILILLFFIILKLIFYWFIALNKVNQWKNGSIGNYRAYSLMVVNEITYIGMPPSWPGHQSLLPSQSMYHSPSRQLWHGVIIIVFPESGHLFWQLIACSAQRANDPRNAKQNNEIIFFIFLHFLFTICEKRYHLEKSIITWHFTIMIFV